MGKTIYSIFDDNQCVEKLGDKRSKKGIQFRKIPSSFRVSCNNSATIMRAEIAELLTNSFDVKFGRLFIQPPLFRLVHQLLRVL
jgi:hypothetical protein